MSNQGVILKCSKDIVTLQMKIIRNREEKNITIENLKKRGIRGLNPKQQSSIIPPSELLTMIRLSKDKLLEKEDIVDYKCKRSSKGNKITYDFIIKVKNYNKYL